MNYKVFKQFMNKMEELGIDEESFIFIDETSNNISFSKDGREFILNIDEKLLKVRRVEYDIYNETMVYDGHRRDNF